METNKVTCWGALDVSARTLEGLTDEFQRLYDNGNYRMRPEDVRRMGILLRRISAANRKVGGTLKQFKALNK